VSLHMLCCGTGRVMYKTSIDLQESLFTCLRLLCRRAEVSEAAPLYFEHPVNHTEHPVNHAAVPHPVRFSDISCSCAIPRAFVQHPIAQIRTTANRLLRTVICIIKTWQSREDNNRVLGFSLRVMRLLGWHHRTKPYILSRSCKFSGSEKYSGSKAVLLVSDFCGCCFQSSVSVHTVFHVPCLGVWALAATGFALVDCVQWCCVDLFHTLSLDIFRVVSALKPEHSPGDTIVQGNSSFFIPFQARCA